MMLTAALLVLGACAGDPADPGHFDGLSANVRSIRSSTRSISVSLRDSVLTVGDTATLVVGIRDRFGRDVARFLSAKFRSNDTTVATVNSKGLVTIEGEGSTWIVVRTSSELRDSVAVGTLTQKLPEGTARSPNAPVEVEPAPPSAPPAAAPPAVAPSVPEVPPSNFTPDPDVFTDTVTVAPTQATLPRRFVTHTFPTSSRRISLRQGDNLQAALDTSRQGDEIVLARGATFSGGFTLRKKAGSGWIVLRSESEPAPLGVRPRPSQFASAAKLITAQNGVPVLDAEPGASGYWISGLEIAAAANVNTLGSLVFFSPAGNVANDVPSRIVIERSYVHGHDQLNMQRCVHFDATNGAVTDSWISDCHFRGLDSQALLVITSPGQLLFRNNFLAGAGENLMIGGGAPGVTGMLPEDIEIVGNHFFKPLSWQAAGWTVKNLLEIKIGRRIDIRENYLENNWVMGQIGFAVVIKASDQGPTSPWVRTSDIVFRRNIVSGSAGGVNIFEDGPVGTNRIAILANQFSNIGLTSLGGVGRMLQLIGRLTDIEVRQNTMVFGQNARTASSAIMMDGRGSERLTIVNNIFEGGEYGFILSGGGSGLTGVQQFAATSSVVGNAVSVGSGVGYGSQNSVVPTVAGFGFVNVNAGDFRLVSSSSIRNSGARGATPGVPAGALTSAAAARSQP